MESYIREARMVMLGFFIKDRKIQERANQIIETKTAETLQKLGNLMSYNEARARAIDAYYEMGLRYFKRYASKEWRMFLTETAKQKLDNIKAEEALIDEVIAQMKETIRVSKPEELTELGRYLITKVRLERAVTQVETEMFNLIEGPYFKSHILPDVVKHFYSTYQASQETTNTAKFPSHTEPA